MSVSGFSRFGMVALVMGVLAGSTSSGCASERDPINRVQANAIPKSFFVGARLNDASDDPEFYSRTMIVDVPYGESGSDGLFNTNMINRTARIKWSIEEANLVGRISFERIKGTDGAGKSQATNPARDPNKPLVQNDGVIVYNFRILSQFDIRRAYNPSTGEENNVVEENATDRPWYEREYVRVDFSKNLVTTGYDFDTMSLLGMYGAVKYTPMEFDVRNPLDENAPTYDVKNGYLDVTNKVFAEPQMVDLGGFMVPACYLPNYVSGGTDPVGNCNPNEITLRHSWKRVENTDYEPTDWDGFRFESYGAFTTDRNGYAKDYGVADAEWKRFISRHNIWKRSHIYDKPDTLEGSYTCKYDSDCAALGGIDGISHCDVHKELCTLPYQSRQEKPVVWHYSQGSAPDYFDPSREAVDEWDTAMREAVQVAKYAECMRFGNLNEEGVPCAQTFPGAIEGNYADEEDALYLVKEVNACRRQARADGKKDPVAECVGLADQLSDQRRYAPAVRALAKLPEMVVLCHSPVDKLDSELCGKPGTIARKGDLRYNLVTAVPTPETGAGWGIMTDGNDPLTGEHVSGNVNVWSNVTDMWSRNLVDVLRYIGGELATEEVTDGANVNRWVDAARASNGVGMAPVMDGAEVDKRVAAAAGTTVEKLHALEAKLRAQRPQRPSPAQRKPLEQALIGNLRQIEKTHASLNAESVWAPIYAARMNQLRGTPAEAAIVTPAMQQLAKSAIGDLTPGSTSGSGSNAMFNAASILGGLNPQLRKDLNNRLQVALADSGSCIMTVDALAPLAYTALAEELQNKFGRFNAAEPEATKTARADRMKDYIRRNAHRSVLTHELGHSFGERHNFVSSSDAYNFRPQYWALRTNGKTVTDDCPADASADGTRCIGPRWLDKVTSNEQRNMIHLWASSSTMEYPGEPSQDLLGLGVYDFAAARMFYADAVTVYKDGRFLANRGAGQLAQEHQNDFGGLLGFRYGDFSQPVHYSHLDRTVSLIEGCAQVDPVSFKPTNWDDAKDGAWSPLLDGHIVTNEGGRPTKCTQPKVDYVQWTAMRSTADKTHSIDSANRVRVPHSFASDEWADLGNVTVMRQDNGADLYEQMHFWQAQQEMNHIFANYRRGRRDFSIWSAFLRSMDRYQAKMRDAAKAIGLYVTLARDTVVQYNAEGEDPTAFVATILKDFALDNTVASSIAFDYFTHVFSRPQPGAHGPLGDEQVAPGVILARSYDSTAFTGPGGGPALLQVANGVSGGYGTISFGGRPIENALARDQGRDYNREYTLNVGSYYEKAFTAYLMTESQDNFISSSRDDFVDPRFRAVSIADVFPDGFRRWLANNLTDDEQIKGVHARSDGPFGILGNLVLQDGYASLANTSWWPKEGVEVCLPQGDRLFCHDPYTPAVPSPAGSTVIDPEVGFEQQKFALIMTLLYLPDNAKTNWVDMLRIYDVSQDTDPGFENRIEFHNPDGKVYVAQTFGTEVIFGKTVQKGIGARVLEWANSLMAKAVVTEPVMRGGREVGLKAKLSPEGNVQYVNGVTPVASCAQSKYCQQLVDYAAIPRLMFQMEQQLGMNRFGGWLRGVY